MSDKVTAVQKAFGEGENLPAEPDGLDYTGYEDLDPDSFIIPRVRIGQPTSETGTPGMLIMNLTGEEKESIRVVAIKAERGRVLWDEDLSSNKPLCRAFNMLYPDPRIENPQNDVCAEYVIKGTKKVLKQVCEKGMWLEDKKPECSETYNVLFLDLDEMIPFWMSIQRTSIKAIRRYISAIALRRKKLWAFETVLSLEKHTEPKPHYVLSFSPPTPIADEDKAELFEFVEQYKHESIDKTIAAEEAAGEGAEGENGDVPDWMNDND